MTRRARAESSRFAPIFALLSASATLGAAASEAPVADEPVLQPMWAEFERLRLPAASTGEDVAPLEGYLEGLKARESTCLHRLPHADSLRKQSDELKAALDRTGADLDPSQVAERVSKCGEGLEIKLSAGAERGTPFQLVLSGPGAKGGLSNAVVCAASALPTWRLTAVESSTEGWKATGMLQLLAGSTVIPPPPAIPAKAAGEARRSSELRLRIAAAAPAVEACEKKLTEAGIDGLDAFEARVEAAEHLRAADALVRPTTLLIFGLANTHAVPPRSILIKEDGDGAHLEIRPLAAGVALRKKLRNPIAGLRVGHESYGDDLLELHVWRKETLRSLRALGRTTEDPAFQKLLTLTAAVKTRASDTLSHAEPELAAAMTALLLHAEQVSPTIDDARLFAARREELVKAIEAQGIGVDPKSLKAKAEACGAQVDGKLPKGTGQAERLGFKGTFAEGPFPYTCLHRSVRSFALDKHVRAGKTWKLEGHVVLVPPAKVTGKPAYVPALPPMPTRPNRTRGADAKAWRQKLTELHTFLKAQHDRLATLPLGEIETLEATYDALSAHEAWPGEAIAFEKAFFEPPADLELPLWMDFSFKYRDEVRLNMAPKDKAYGLMQLLKKAGCRIEKSKAVGDSVRAELDCLPKDHPGRTPDDKKKKGK